VISKILKHIDFDRANALLEGFNKSTGFVTAILDLDGNILSQSGWRQICTDFHRKNAVTASNCFVSDTVLGEKTNVEVKYLYYPCLNGLIDVRMPIIIRGEHIANLFSGQFFFEEPDIEFFKIQAKTYGFDEKTYLEALEKVPVVSKEEVEAAMDFLLYITQLIIEMTIDKIELLEINEAMRISEAALSESQNLLRQNNHDLLESQRIAHLGTWRLDLATNRVVWSEELYKMYGFDPALPPPPYTEHMKLFTHESWDRLSTALEHTQTSGIPYELELETVTEDGSNGWMWARGEAETDSEGNSISLWGAAQDITDQKKAEKVLIESEERYKHLFEYSGVGIGYYTPDGVVISYNKKAIQNLGGKLGDYIGKSIKELFPEEEADLYLARIEKAKLSDQPQEYEDYLVLNSRPIWFFTTVTRVINAAGEIIGVQFASLDISERKQTEGALLESQALLKAAFENSQAGIAIADAPDGKLRYVNKAGLLIRDKTEEEIVKDIDIHNYVDSWGILHFDGTPFAEDEVPLTKAVLYGETSSAEFIIRRDDLEDRYVLANAVPIKDINNNIKAGMVVFLDITERKQAEESIRKQNDLFASLLKILPVGVFMVDAVEGKPLVANDIGKSLLGRGILPDASEGNLSNVYKAYKRDTEEIYPTSEMPIVLGMKGISSHIDDMVVERPDGTRIRLEVFGSPVTDKEGKPWASLVTFLDITERKKSEVELNRVMKLNQRILDNLQDAYFQTDLSGKFTVVNPRAVQMYSYSSTNGLIGQPASNLYADPVELKRLIDALKSEGAVADFVTKGLRYDGTTFWVSMNVQFVKDDQDRIIGTEGLVRDISERTTMIREIEDQRDHLFASNVKLAHLLEQSVKSISKIGELRDAYTAGHQRRVQDLSCAIARQLGLSDNAIINLSYGALIHDIGKIYIPSEILNKPGKISNLEFQIIQTHVEHGYNVVKEIDFPDVIPDMVYQHHERLDGSGYPQGLSGGQIIIESRILAVSDVVEAMTSHRPYRPALGIDAALEEILKYSGQKYDPNVVDACIQLFKVKGFHFSDSIIDVS
jgi:PAS domain S-box-containing protein/putative nucleotidyltransferase with HDIG domain